MLQLALQLLRPHSFVGRRLLQSGADTVDDAGGPVVERADTGAQRLHRVVGQNDELPQPEAHNADSGRQQEPADVVPAHSRILGEVETHGQQQQQLTRSHPPAPHSVGAKDQRQQDDRVQPVRRAQAARERQRQGKDSDAEQQCLLAFSAPGIDDDQGADEADCDREKPDRWHRASGKLCDDDPHGQPCGHSRQRRARRMIAAQRARVGGIDSGANCSPPVR